jgi:hypothetical protein
MKLMPELLSILFLLFVVILFYGWIGVVAFYDSPEGADSFSNLVEAMWTLWICVTTANYPDVMMASYNQSRWTVLYFVSFMMVTFFFMMNIILASVVNSYDNDTEAREKMLDEMIQHNLKQAFQLLCKEGTDRINRDTIMSLFLVLNEDFHDIRYVSRPLLLVGDIHTCWMTTHSIVSLFLISHLLISMDFFPITDAYLQMMPNYYLPF